jgi:glycosyltransferase involved in cell wall biosynthesis
MLFDMGHQVDVAFNIEAEVVPGIYKMGCKVHQLPFQRNPLKKDNLLAYKLLKNLIINEDYNLVHTHTPVASAVVRLVCKHIPGVKVIYTAHGFHFYKGAPLKNWILYYSIEKWLSKYTDTLITINEEDFERAKKYFKARRTEYINGIGLNLKRINGINIDKISERNKLGIPNGAIAFISVGELNNNKNHKTVIKAMHKLNNPNIYYFICGKGYLENDLIKLISNLKMEEQVKLLGYRKDVLELYKSMDIFVFPSFREGLSVALMESMASELPVVCSKIRGNTDLIDEQNGGVFFDSHSIDSCKEAISELLTKDLKDMGKYNKEKVQEFSLESVLYKLKKLYKEDL